VAQAPTGQTVTATRAQRHQLVQRSAEAFQWSGRAYGRSRKHNRERKASTMRKTILTLFAGAACALGGAIASTSLGDVHAAPAAGEAQVTNARAERALVQTAFNTGYLRGIRDQTAAIECQLKGGCGGVDRYSGSVVGLLDRINQSVMRVEQKIGS
jgi:hypothetical protein